ncbi:unnamed protein product [Onchocerca flexuosa]|uniref:Fatty-acid and retinol-binding protein 1 n=1 Tax=Onchocerca flexuosa TaxID=387005 RepID=A0A183I090_9BILA|nr:unnamed protein product [Onchocerca flexuosa]
MIVKFFFGVIFCVSKMALEIHSFPTEANHAVETDKAYEDKFSCSTNMKSVQHELNVFYNNLTAEEKMQLKKFAKISAANFSLTDTEFLDGLKIEAAGLFSKLIGLRDIINTKLDTMQPESRLFIEKLLRRFLAAFSQDGLINILESLKGFGKEVIDMFDGLSKPIQNDILNAFPLVGSYITSDIARLMLRKLAELDLLSRKSTLTPTVDRNKDDSGKHFPISQVIDPEEPENLDPEAAQSTNYGMKKEVTTTVYPLITDEEDEVLVKKISVDVQLIRQGRQPQPKEPSIHLPDPRAVFLLLSLSSNFGEKKIHTFSEFIPSSLLTFFGDLNDTDRNALLELTRNISRSRLTTDTEKEFLEGLEVILFLQKKSENAYQKVMGVQNYLSHRIERLKPESNCFIKELSDRYVALFTNPQTAPRGTFMKLKLFANETFQKHDQLSAVVKNDLREAFPEIAELITNPRFRDYVRRVFENTDVKRAFNRADRMINPKQ